MSAETIIIHYVNCISTIYIILHKLIFNVYFLTNKMEYQMPHCAAE